MAREPTAPARRRTAPRRADDVAAAELSNDRVLEFMQVLWALDHGLTRISKQMFRTLGVTGPQRLVIRLLGLKGELSAGELADALHLHPSTLTGILQRLTDRGFVSRGVDPADARRARLTLTAAGRKLDRVQAGTVEAEVRAAVAGISEADLLATRRVLSRVARRLPSR